MHRSSSRSTAGMNNRCSSKEYVLASFLKSKKHAILPITAININPINSDKAEIKICGDITPLTIVSKGTRAQVNMDKTKFARETGSKEIDLGNFIDDEEEEKENQEDDFDLSTSVIQTSPLQRCTISKENSNNKPSESYSSSRSSITHTTMDKTLIDFDTIFNTSGTSKKHQYDSDSSLDGTNDDDEEEAPRIPSKKRTDGNDDNTILNKLLNKKKAPQKKRKSIASITSGSTETTCKGCKNLSEQVKNMMKRLERVERVVPIVKEFSQSKIVGLDATRTTTISMTKIEDINKSIKDIFDIEANKVKGSRERPTIIIRNLFTLSNHVTDYRLYLEKHADLLKAFLQYRCPGIVNIDQTWQEVIKSMASLANNIKKNLKTKLARQIATAMNTQQQSITTISTNDMNTSPYDNVEMEVII